MQKEPLHTDKNAGFFICSSLAIGMEIGIYNLLKSNPVVII